MVCRDTETRARLSFNLKMPRGSGRDVVIHTKTILQLIASGLFKNVFSFRWHQAFKTKQGLKIDYLI